MKTGMFRYYSCSFKVSEDKQSTARAVIFKQYNIPFTYTIEASKSSYYCRDELRDVKFDDEKWLMMGESIAEALRDYLSFVFEEEEIKRRKRMERKLVSERRERTKF